MAEAITVNTVSAVFQRQIKALKPGVSALAKALGAVRVKSKDIGPKVIGLFNKLKAEYAGLSFVDFCRMFDPNVPTHAADRDGVKGYRTNPTYYALDWMRRNENTANRPRGRQGVRDSATDALARSLATILQVIPADGEAAIWEAVQKEFSFGERLMTRLKKRVEDTKPLIALKAPKAITVGNVIHMDRTEPQEREAAEGREGAGEALAQAGRRVKRAA